MGGGAYKIGSLSQKCKMILLDFFIIFGGELS